MQDEPKTFQVKRLFSGWPSQAANLTPEQVGLYVEASTSFADGDFSSAIDDFLFGRVSDHNKRFLPSVSEMSDHTRRVRNARLDYQARNKLRLPPPPLANNGDIEQRKAFVARVMAPYRAMMADNLPTARQHDEAKARVILEALGGDEAALAAYRAENATIKPSAEFLKSVQQMREMAT